jgi:nicotinamidase-related amidase
MKAEGPNRPQPQNLILEPGSTSVLVLDLSSRCEDPREICAQLMEPLAEFLEKARQAAVPIFYTISAAARGSPSGEVGAPLKRRATETVIYPDAFDKFVGGELRDHLEKAGCRTLVIVGSATNFAVLYTATTAARVYRYDVVIPLDGVNARRQYEHEYAIHQMTILPASANKQFRFTTLAQIEWGQGHR